MASSAVDIDIGTRLAIDRTRLAYERTLMAWVRTAVSMITFGFTIYKFFEFELKDRPVPSGSVLSPHEFGLVMITIGLVALLLSTVQHRQSMRALRAEYGTDPARVRRRDRGGPVLGSGAAGAGHGAAAMVNGLTAFRGHFHSMR